MNSTSGNKSGGFAARIWQLIKASFIARFFIVPKSFILNIPHESFIDEAWTKSVAYGIFDWVLNLIPRAFRALYLRFQEKFDESLIFGIISWLSEGIDIVAGLFMFCLLIIPGKYWNNMFSLIGAIAIAVLFVARAMKKKQILKTELISPYILAFAVFVFVSFITSYYRSLSFRFLIFHFTCMLLVPVLVSVLDDRKKLNNFIIITLAGFSVAILYGCYQSVVGVPVLGWQMDTTANGMDMPGRVFAFFENPNAFAEIIAMLAPFYVVTAINNKNKNVRLPAVLFLAASVGVMAMTLSRAGYVAFVAELLLAILFYNWKLVPLLAAACVLALPFMPSTISNRILALFMGDTSLTSRASTYNSALKLLRDHWTLGVGLGVDPAQQIVNYNSLYSNGYKFIHSHNTYIQLWLETGMLGFLAFLGAMANLLKHSASLIIDKSCPKDLKNVILAGAAGILGILLFGLVDYIWFYPRIMVIFWVVVALTIAAVKLASSEAESKLNK